MIRIGLSCGSDRLREASWEGSAGSRVNQAYIQSVLRAGAAPVLIPVIGDGKALAAILDFCDGLLLTGGGDLDPALYGEEKEAGTGPISVERDTCELLLFDLAVRARLPLFGICRGMQLINVALGGTLHQELEGQPDFFIRHKQQCDRQEVTHEVSLQAGSLLHTCLGDRIQVNSLHHQAVKDLAPGLTASAWSPDKIIEGLEGGGGHLPPILAVQWHPEELAQDMPPMAELFSSFVRICQERKDCNQIEST